MRTSIIAINDPQEGLVFRIFVAGLPDSMRGFSVFGKTPEEALEKAVKMLLDEAKSVYLPATSG